MNYYVSQNHQETIVFLDGQVDLSQSPHAKQLMMDSIEKGKKVVIDMSGVDYLDSSGVASLVDALQESQKKKVEFGLKDLSKAALKELRLARLDSVFNIY